MSTNLAAPGAVNEIGVVLLSRYFHPRAKRARVDLRRQTLPEDNLFSQEPEFTGTPAECAAYAGALGFEWRTDFDLLFGGFFQKPDEPVALYPT